MLEQRHGGRYNTNLSSLISLCLSLHLCITSNASDSAVSFLKIPALAFKTSPQVLPYVRPVVSRDVFLSLLGASFLHAIRLGPPSPIIDTDWAWPPIDRPSTPTAAERLSLAALSPCALLLSLAPFAMSETAVEPLGQRPDPVEEARDAAKEPSTDVYHNPLESSSRMGLAARAYAYRTGAAIAFGMGNMVPPVVPSPAKTIYFDSTLSAKYSGKDKIKADVWTPDRPRSLSRKSSRSSIRSNKSKSGKSKKNKGGDADAGAADGLDSLNPSLSRFESAVSVTDDETPAAAPQPVAKKRPSTISRLSSRLSTRSSKSLKSKSSLSLPNTPSAGAAATTDPMEQIPTMLTPQADPHARRPAVINFHGGGFVLGQATDDGRWAMAVMQALGAVVFSVEYRLAPSYPFPTPVEDCADAILQIWRRADEFWIDPDKIILSGFSAGGTLALASWTLLADYKRWGYDVRAQPSPSSDLAARASKSSLSDGDSGAAGERKDGAGADGAAAAAAAAAAADVPRPAGLMLFYPLLDWTQSRPRKRLTCAKPELTLPRNLTDIFDAAYLYPPEEIKAQLDNPLLSPGLLPDDLVDRLPPVQMCLCEYDMLLAEGRRFVDRLRARGREVGYRVVEGAKHAWDKPLPFSPPENLGVEYGEAVRVMAGWIGREEGNGSGEDLPPREVGGGATSCSNGAGEAAPRYGEHLEVS